MTPTPDKIIAAAAREWRVSLADLLAPKKGPAGSPTAPARAAAALLLRNFCPTLKSVDAARALNLAGNATMDNLVSRARKLMEADPAWRARFEKVGHILDGTMRDDGELAARMAELARADRASVIVPLREAEPTMPAGRSRSIDFIREQAGRMSDAAIMRALGLRRQSDYAALRALAGSR